MGGVRANEDVSEVIVVQCEFAGMRSAAHDEKRAQRARSLTAVVFSSRFVKENIGGASSSFTLPSWLVTALITSRARQACARRVECELFRHLQKRQVEQFRSPPRSGQQETDGAWARRGANAMESAEKLRL